MDHARARAVRPTRSGIEKRVGSADAYLFRRGRHTRRARKEPAMATKPATTATGERDHEKTTGRASPTGSAPRSAPR